MDAPTQPPQFRALYVPEPEGGSAEIREIGLTDLDEGEVIIRVRYSSLNYKDALAISGGAPIVRRFPMIGGIDLAGEIVESADTALHPGDTVVVTGCGMGETHHGGYAEVARVPARWCEPIPEGLTVRTAMILGTAGVTAMLSLLALERNRSAPHDLKELPLVVTGASGGVGSLAIMLAARLGYRVVASTGRPEEESYLRGIGADEVIDRNELSLASPGVLGRVRFGAGLDGVGGTTLVNLIRSVRPEGTIAAYGLASSADLSLTVHPFILRGVTLAGINSVHLTMEDRHLVWQRLAELCSGEILEPIAKTTDLEGLLALSPAILAGGVRGRVVVDLAADR
jgi:acrylyl-CoA reductase (NADPH)